MRQWKIIPGYDGAYRVSDDGIVQSCCRPGTRGKRGEWWDLSLPLDKAGYQLVYIWDRTARKRVRCHVHRLVAEAFVPGVSDGPCVNHKNGRKRDNRASNLEWCTRTENMQHAWRTGLCKPQKLTPELVREIRTCGGLDTQTAARFGISQVMVTKIRARKAWRHVA